MPERGSLENQGDLDEYQWQQNIKAVERSGPSREFYSLPMKYDV
jgi:hypothetical protein